MGRRRRRRTRGADETWQEIPFSVPVLCVRQLLLLGITLWAVWPLPVSNLTAASVQPAIRQFLVSSFGLGFRAYFQCKMESSSFHPTPCPPTFLRGSGQREGSCILWKWVTLTIAHPAS